MPLKGVLQSRWLKGLNGAFGIFSQPPNSVPKISNLLMTRLGSFETTPGSRIVSSFQNQGIAPWFPTDSGMWKEIFYYNPSDHPERAGYYGLREEPAFPRLQGSVGAPHGSVISSPGASPFPGNQFAVTAADGVGGESALSPAVILNTTAGQGVQLTFNYVTNAYGYNIYVLYGGVWRRLIPYGAVDSFTAITVINHPPVAPATTLTFALAFASSTTAPVVAVAVGSTTPPASDTTQSCNFVLIPVDGTGWNYNVTTNLIYVFPADTLPNPGGGGSGDQGGGRVPSGGGGPAGTVNGGVSGVISPIPQIIQFADKMILALGNGIPPYTSVAFQFKNTVPITNTFQATFPDWQPGIGYITGDQIVPATGNAGNYLFTATQGGISSTTTAPQHEPVWPQTIDVTVPDNQIIWKNSGVVTTVAPAPLGAAHAEVYAGSLWLANTRPAFNQRNPSDGPSALWMSDANNPNSWNPLNTAQVARDDGTEIMGLKAFSIAEAGIPTTQQLVVFKNFTTYVINGVFGASDFSIQQAETDQGCVAPRSIQFIPGFGLMRLTHLGFSYFDGIRDTLVSTDIHPWLFGDINQPVDHPVSPAIDWAFAYFSKAAQVADPPMYICAVPVLGANSDLLGSIPASQFTIVPNAGVAGGTVPPLFPPGQYYFRISLRSPIMETAVTPEIGPITIPSSGAGPSFFQVSSSAPLPPGYTGWKIYWGSNGPGSESHYQDTGPELYLPGGVQTRLTYPGLPTTGPPTGLSGTLTRIFCYDLTLKCWTKIELPFSISVLKQFRIMGEPPVTICGGFWDNTVRRLFSNAPDWDGTSIYWYVQSAEVYNQGGDQRVFYRRVRVRGSGNGPIYITPSYDGAKNSFTLPAVFRALGSNQFMAEEGMMEEAVNCHVLIEGLGQVSIDSIDFHAVPKPVGAGVVIS